MVCIVGSAAGGAAAPARSHRRHRALQPSLHGLCSAGLPASCLRPLPRHVPSLAGALATTQQHWASAHSAVSGLSGAAAYEEYYGEDGDFGWRTDFEASFAAGAILGQGSFGTCQLAIDIHTGQSVAVKVLPKVRGKLSRERTLEKLAREVDVLERLQGCGGVISLLDVFENTDHVFICTELCSGGDLQNHSEVHGALDERALAHVALEVLKVVRSCHKAGLLHGDVKPANFCLKHASLNPLTDPHGDYSDYFTSTSVSWLKAIDFGCSQMLPAHGRKLTKRTGTPVYMAPEIYQREYGREADMWSVGIMLYQLYAKRFPFWNSMEACKSCNLEEVAAAVANVEIQMNEGPWLHMSPAGRAFIGACLQRDPAARLTVDAALSHPWLAEQLFNPLAQHDSAVAPCATLGAMQRVGGQNGGTGSSLARVTSQHASAPAA